MALTPGTRLGGYEIAAQIGKGGMGEVYRARDLKLGRDVAIKVLPENVAREQDRLARFEREARTLASLNHPNIANIYGLEDNAVPFRKLVELPTGPRIRGITWASDGSLIVGQHDDTSDIVLMDQGATAAPAN